MPKAGITAAGKSSAVDLVRSDIERGHSRIVDVAYRLDRFRLHYPWAIMPTITTRKPVATAIATFVSIVKFIIFPFNYGGDPVAPFLIFPFSRSLRISARLWMPS
jgi:hypothetical protein